MLSSMRLPRHAHGVPVISKSSGHGLTPTPRVNRLPESTAALEASLATCNGWRIGSFNTDTVNRSRSVTMPSAEISANGSRNGLPSRNSREPSGLKG